MQHAKLAFLLIVLISAPIAYVIITRASSDPPAVVLKFDNYQASLQPTIIGYPDDYFGYVGITVSFTTHLNFTITNAGNETSREFLIFVNPQATKWVVPANPNPITVQPIQPNETRLIDLRGYSGRSYPDLTVQYYVRVDTFHFGDQINMTSPIGVG